MQTKLIDGAIRLELTSTPTPSDSYVPFKIGEMVAERFVIERLAGSGGMGHVFQALDVTTRQRVAIKVMHCNDAATKERLTRESLVLKKIEHRHIVRHIEDGFLRSNEPYLVMEWLEGETLAARLGRGPITPDAGLSLGALLADALGALHARGIVHRDVKPHNVLLVGCALDEPKLLDLGIAHVDNATRMTRTGAVLGTLAYMAPEQVRAERDVDARADVFALGCLIFECLTGKPPFGGRSMRELVSTILFVEAPLLRHCISDAPEQLEALLASMLSKSRSNRPSDGHAVAQALRSIGAFG